MRQPRVRVAALTVGIVVVAAGAMAVTAQGPVLQTVEVESTAVKRTMRYNIVLPQGYDSSSQRYPVLYLLHGLGGNYSDWGALGAPFYARLYGALIIVMPDGGNSWYVNYSESEDEQANNWEDWIVEDMIGHVDTNFRTIDRREGRAISGLSMGGFGAIALGLRHPDMFAAIGSTSGALEYASRAAERLRSGSGRPTPELSPREQALRDRFQQSPNPVIGVDDFDSQAERTPNGTPFVTAEDADAYDPFTLVLQIPKGQLPHIYLDCGTEDRLIDGAVRFAQLLTEERIPFEFMQLHGGHNGAYWTRSLGHIVAGQYEVMRRQLGERPDR